jgi:hypothetical protein
MLPNMLIAFSFVQDTLPTTAAETAERIRLVRERMAREARAKHRTDTAPQPRVVLRPEPSREASDLAVFRRALERFVRSTAIARSMCGRGSSLQNCK